jgi:hypothetical protein
MRSDSVLALHAEGFFDDKAGEEEEEDEKKAGPAGMVMVAHTKEPQMSFAVLCRSEHTVMYFKQPYDDPEVGEDGRMPGSESKADKKLANKKGKEAAAEVEAEAKEEAYWAAKEAKEAK